MSTKKHIEKKEQFYKLTFNQILFQLSTRYLIPFKTQILTHQINKEQVTQSINPFTWNR